uniref:Putative secreted protein n=1 Tax=Anopheles darlingi TaxID=43151 RepID=A0A2M4DGR3_ANODA
MAGPRVSIGAHLPCFLQTSCAADIVMLIWIMCLDDYFTTIFTATTPHTHAQPSHQSVNRLPIQLTHASLVGVA